VFEECVMMTTVSQGVATDPHERAAIEAVADAFTDSWNRHDMQAFAALYAEDADFVNVYGLWWKGRDEIRVAHEETHVSLFSRSHLAHDFHEVRMLTPDLAICRTTWRLTGVCDRSLRPMPDRRGRLMHVLQRRSGRWQIVATQNTDITPMP
jgi:uncharacterized protein (TIGR02246 family)